MRPPQAGQATAEYVAVVTLVAVVLAAAATLVAAPDLPGAVVRQVRLALCVAGGDVCRAADARARGLEPCVRDSTEHVRDTSVTIGIWRAGHGRSYTIAERSDGTVSVSGTDDGHVSGTGSLGIGIGGHVQASGSGSAGLRFERGREWVFGDLRAARTFLARVDDPMHLSDDGDVHRATGTAAPIRYREGGGELGATLAAELSAARVGHTVTAADAGLNVALGRRTGPDGTTLFYEVDARTGGLLADVVPALDRSRHVVLEWHDGRPSTVTLSQSAPAGAGRSADVRLRLALTRPGDREAALELALAPLAGPAAALVARDFVQRVRERGTVERQVFAQERDEGGFNATLRAGGGLGVDHLHGTTRRRLIAAEVVVGGLRAQRVDCVGLERS